MERGEQWSFSLRIRPAGDARGELQLAEGGSDKVKARLRRESSGSGYWLDLDVGPIKDEGAHPVTIKLRAADDGSAALNIELAVNVLAESLIITPRQLDLGNIALSELKGGALLIGRMGVRKAVGTFRLKSVSTSLPFIKADTRVIIEGSNYLIALVTDPASPPKAGPYSGVLLIETTDAARPRIEVPIKVVITTQ